MFLSLLASRPWRKGEREKNRRCSTPSPLEGEGWGEGFPAPVLPLTKNLSLVASPTPSPLEGEGWGEGFPAPVLPLTKNLSLVAR